VAKRAARKRAPGAAEGEQQGTALDKIAALLGLLVVKDMETDDASVRLGNVGFSDREIAALIGVTDGYVRLARFRAKKSGRKARKK
jgi:hypothetical protein